MTSLSPDEPVRAWPVSTVPPEIPGRRLRVFMALAAMPLLRLAGIDVPIPYREALTALHGHAAFAALELRSRPEMAHTIAELKQGSRNADLPDCLQDLADEVIVDTTEACGALRDPDLWYPGVDEGIEPVPDEHVKLVIAAMQRELNRELRTPLGKGYPAGNLPAVQLTSLPWRVQRALAERRRLRFAQYGIDRAAWERGTWSLWNVPEEPDWIPRRPL